MLSGESVAVKNVAPKIFSATSIMTTIIHGGRPQVVPGWFSMSRICMVLYSLVIVIITHSWVHAKFSPTEYQTLKLDPSSNSTASSLADLIKLASKSQEPVKATDAKVNRTNSSGVKRRELGEEKLQVVDSAQQLSHGQFDPVAPDDSQAEHVADFLAEETLEPDESSGVNVDYDSVEESELASFKRSSGLNEHEPRRLDIDPPGGARHKEVERLVRDQVELAASNWATLAPGDYLLNLSGSNGTWQRDAAESVRSPDSGSSSGSGGDAGGGQISELARNHRYEPHNHEADDLTLATSVAPWQAASSQVVTKSKFDNQASNVNDRPGNKYIHRLQRPKKPSLISPRLLQQRTETRGLYKQASNSHIVRAFEKLDQLRGSNSGGILEGSKNSPPERPMSSGSSSSNMHTLYASNSKAAQSQADLSGKSRIEFQMGKISSQGFMDLAPTNELEVPQSVTTSASTTITSIAPTTLADHQAVNQSAGLNLNGSLAARLSANRLKHRKNPSGRPVTLDRPTTRAEASQLETSDMSGEQEEDQTDRPLTIQLTRPSKARLQPERAKVTRPIVTAPSSQMQRSKLRWQSEGEGSRQTSAVSHRPLLRSTLQSAAAEVSYSGRPSTTTLMPPHLLSALYAASIRGAANASSPATISSPAATSSNPSTTLRPPARYHHLHSHIHNIKPALISIPVPIAAAQSVPRSSPYESVLAAAAAAAAAATAAAHSTSTRQRIQQQQRQLFKAALDQRAPMIAAGARLNGNVAANAQRLLERQQLGQRFAIPIGGTLASSGALQPSGAPAPPLKEAERGDKRAPGVQHGLLASLVDSATRAIKQVTGGSATSSQVQSDQPLARPALSAAGLQRGHQARMPAANKHSNNDNRPGGLESAPSRLQHFQRTSMQPQALTMDQMKQLLPEALEAAELAAASMDDASGGSGEGGQLRFTQSGTLEPIGLLQAPQTSDQLPTISQPTWLTSYLADLLTASAAAQEHEQQQQLLASGAASPSAASLADLLHGPSRQQQQLLHLEHLFKASHSQQAQQSEQINTTANPVLLEPDVQQLAELQLASNLASHPLLHGQLSGLSTQAADSASHHSGIPDLLDGVIFAPIGQGGKFLYPIMTSSNKPASHLDQLLDQLEDYQQPEGQLKVAPHGDKKAGQPMTLSPFGQQDQGGSSLVSSFDSPHPQAQLASQSRVNSNKLESVDSGKQANSQASLRQSHHSAKAGALRQPVGPMLNGSRTKSKQHRRPPALNDEHKVAMPYALSHYIDEHDSLGATLNQHPLGGPFHPLPIDQQLGSFMMASNDAFRPITLNQVSGRLVKRPGQVESLKYQAHINGSSEQQQQQSSYEIPGSKQNFQSGPFSHQPIDVISFDDNAMQQQQQHWPIGGNEEGESVLGMARGRSRLPSEQNDPSKQQQQQAAVAQFVYVPASEILHQALLHASSSAFRPHIISAAAGDLLSQQQRSHLIDQHLGSLLLGASQLAAKNQMHHSSLLGSASAQAAAQAAARLRKVAAAAAANDLATSESVRLGALLAPGLRGHFLTHYWPLALALLPIMICVAIVAQLVMAAPLAMFALTTLAVSRVAGSLFGPPPFSSRSDEGASSLHNSAELGPGQQWPANSTLPYALLNYSHSNISAPLSFLAKLSNEKLVSKLYSRLEKRIHNMNSTKEGATPHVRRQAP